MDHINDIFDILKLPNLGQKDNFFFGTIDDKEVFFNNLPSILEFNQKQFYLAMDELEEKFKMYNTGLVELTHSDLLLMNILIKLLRLKG